jgi:hypothetical protein
MSLGDRLQQLARTRARSLLLAGLRSLLLAALLVAWTMVGVAALSAVAGFMDVRVTLVLVCGIGVVPAVGGLVIYWVLADEIDFQRHGYRIRQLSPTAYFRWTPGPTNYAYEEFDSGGEIRKLPFVRVMLEEAAYPAKSEVLFPAEHEWDTRVPAWARGRRAEIVERVLERAVRSAARNRTAA